jgi:hypothetical protein
MGVSLAVTPIPMCHFVGFHYISYYTTMGLATYKKRCIVSKHGSSVPKEKKVNLQNIQEDIGI